VPECRRHHLQLQLVQVLGFKRGMWEQIFKAGNFEQKKTFAFKLQTWLLGLPKLGTMRFLLFPSFLALVTAAGYVNFPSSLSNSPMQILENPLPQLSETTTHQSPTQLQSIPWNSRLAN